MSELTYPVAISPLAQDDGGGFVATVPDLPGRMSDGETPEEASFTVRDAIQAWIALAHELGHAVPEPARLPERVVG